jgi:flagellar basal-body rod modification protein FlgD
MVVSAAATSSNTSASTGSPTSVSLITGDQFLRLLVAQLTHQDPLNPMEGTEFVSQLAELQSVTTLGDISKYLENSNIGDLYSSTQEWQSFMGSVSTIGRTVYWSDYSGQIQSGEVAGVVRNSTGNLMLVVGDQEIALSDVKAIE